MLNNHVHKWLRQKWVWVLPSIVLCTALLVGRTSAAGSGSDFNIQVSPSPLVVTVKPGKAQTASLTVRNLTNHSETLYPKLVGFSIDTSSKDIKLQDNVPLGLDKWITFNAPVINLAPGASTTVPVNFNTPRDVGFSYSLAITLSRNPNNVIDKNGVQLRGAVAVFCLINIDRPDAKRQLSIETFKSDASRYQYLPATFTLRVKNSGNVIDQPQGTLYIQRSFNSAKPIITMPLNKSNSYILPGTSRELTNTWSQGFPVYTTDASGQKHLSWSWKHLNDLRFGRYVAKVVLVYNDGQRDVPVTSSYTFWVIPWGLIAIILVLIFILVMGIIGWGRLIMHGTKKVRGYAHRR